MLIHFQPTSVGSWLLFVRIFPISVQIGLTKFLSLFSSNSQQQIRQKYFSLVCLYTAWQQLLLTFAILVHGFTDILCFTLMVFLDMALYFWGLKILYLLDFIDSYQKPFTFIHLFLSELVICTCVNWSTMKLIKFITTHIGQLLVLFIRGKLVRKMNCHANYRAMTYCTIFNLLPWMTLLPIDDVITC